MARSTSKDAQALIQSLRSAYAATPTNLKIIDLYVVFAILTAVIQVVYMALVGSFPFNSFLSGVLSCVGTAVLAVCLRIQVNKENKEFKDLAPERAFADFVLCNLVLHLMSYSLPWYLYMPCSPVPHKQHDQAYNTYMDYIIVIEQLPSLNSNTRDQMEDDESKSFEYTSTWVVAVICTVIILLSIVAERGLHSLGKLLKRHNQEALFEALQKLKEELMILGFISLLLTVTQRVINKICIPGEYVSLMLPCKEHGASTSSETPASAHSRRLLASETAGSSGHCAAKNMVPMLSVEAVHQLHIFIFVLAVVHVIFCATTMVLGRARIQRWRHWENAIRRSNLNIRKPPGSPKHNHIHAHHHYEFFKERAVGYWRKYILFGWLRSFFKQFYGSVTKADYLALRQGFIMEHCPSNPNFNFHEYMMRTLSVDFKKVVGISWYLWLFVIIFLLVNIEGWHSYFWLAFLPLALLLVVGAKLEHIITRLAEEVKIVEGVIHAVEPSDTHFWFGKPKLVLYLIHFILFQNSFEIAFFFWILAQFGFASCTMERLEYIIPRLVIGVIVQFLCSYSTLPLYALVTQMGSMFKQGMFDEHVQDVLKDWAEGTKSKGRSRNKTNMSALATMGETSCHSICFEAEAPSRGVSMPMIELCGSPRCHLHETIV